MTAVTLKQSDRIIDAIHARGRELDCRPLSVVVTEPGIRAAGLKTDDDCAQLGQQVRTTN